MSEKSPATTKMVKIKTIRDVRLTDGKVIKPHQTVDVSEEDAKLLCDTKYKMHYDGWGEGHYQRTEMARTVRV